MPESLANEFISDLYTSLLHLSGAKLENKLNKIFKKCKTNDFHTCYECGQMISPLEKHYKKLKKEFAGYFICKPCVVDVISERVLLADE